MKSNLDMDVDIYKNKMKKEQRHTRDKEPCNYFNYLIIFVFPILGIKYCLKVKAKLKSFNSVKFHRVMKFEKRGKLRAATNNFLMKRCRTQIEIIQAFVTTTSEASDSVKIIFAEVYNC